jgi:hypothetical protein
VPSLGRFILYPALVGLDGTGGTADGSAGLTFLGRPLGRGGVAPSVDAGDSWGGMGSTWADVG